MNLSIVGEYLPIFHLPDRFCIDGRLRQAVVTNVKSMEQLVFNVIEVQTWK